MKKRLVGALKGSKKKKKNAMKHSLKEAIKKGKNPFTGRRFTKSQQEELRELMKETK